VTQGKPFAVEDVGETPDLVLRIGQQRLERGHERFHLDSISTTNFFHGSKKLERLTIIRLKKRSSFLEHFA